jgi:hypothetical protein
MAMMISPSTAEEGTQALGDKAASEGGGILQHRLDVVVLEDRISRVTMTLTSVCRYRQTGHEVAFHNRRGLTLLATYGVKIDIQATVILGQGRKTPSQVFRIGIGLPSGVSSFSFIGAGVGKPGNLALLRLKTQNQEVSIYLKMVAPAQTPGSSFV